MDNNERRESIMGRICSLKARLESTASDIGDWKGIKYRDYRDAGYDAPYSDADMQVYYDARKAVRVEINRLEAELNSLN